MTDYLSKRGRPYLQGTNRYSCRIGTSRYNEGQQHDQSFDLLAGPSTKRGKRFSSEQPQPPNLRDYWEERRRITAEKNLAILRARYPL